MRTTPSALLALSLLAACGDNLAATHGGDGGVDGGATNYPPVADMGRDILDTKLELDVSTHEAKATIKLAGSTTSAGASFAVGNLLIRTVEDGAGNPLRFAHNADDPTQLDVGLPPGASEAKVVVRYRYFLTDPNDAGGGFDGMAPNGLTFLWPYFCGNLFPCHPLTADGTTFALSVTGTPTGQMSVYPATIPAEAPAYQIAIATGDYVYEKIGTTTAGTEVGVYYLSGNKANADAGTANLAKYFDFYEKTYGPYSFGAKVGSVEAPWGPGAYGGMEHHPLWHVGSDSMTDNSTHAHEASHGWFGDGVRLLCWEDFVLSEGAADYLAGRAIEAVDGLAAGNAYWAAETSFLDYAVKNYDTIAYPDSCNAIDIFSDPIWSGIPYAKGAFFWKAVETKVGRAALDAALKHFYTTHVGKAAHMQDLIDLVASDTGKSLATEETGWLKSLGHP